jgi:pyruvate formate lyase activating enzyme
MAERRTRREFLATCAAAVCAASATGILAGPRSARAQRPTRGLVRARLSPYFTPLAGGEIRCDLCPHRCRVAPGKRGACRVRENRGGQYYSLVYGNPCALHPDPVEKKPFFHVLPGTTAYSVATAGCNFHCKFCQNWEISQVPPEDLFNHDVPPETLVQRAREARAPSVAYTYVEPTVFAEYMLDTARAARAAGLRNLCHSNGFINPEPLEALSRVLDAANIDLKSFRETFYRDQCQGALAPVLATLTALRRAGVHLEITHLVIPTLNDDLAQIREMCGWIRRELGPGTPVHFARFYPLYKLKNLPPTPVALLEQARAAAMAAGLEYVYIGNVPGHEGENTFCPRCRRLLVERSGFMVRGVHLKAGKCGTCGTPVPGIWA